MITLLWLTFCSIFVSAESTPQKSQPRAVNLALETVIEFDKKDRAYDLRFIDQVQSFLNKVKYVLRKDQNYRRAGKPELKFSDFLRGTLAIINTYKDEDLEKILKTFNEEARKFNYRGCRFYELVQNIPLRRYISKKLDELKKMSLEDVRDRIDEVLKMWNEGKLGKHNQQLLDYLDSLYNDDASEKIAVVLNDLDLYRRDEKQRASIDLLDIVRKGLRSLLFDYYTNLKAKERNGVKLKLESAWNENTEKESHNLYNSYSATDMNKLIEIEFETTTKEGSISKSSKEDEETIKHQRLNKASTKRSHDSYEDDGDVETKELKIEQFTSSSSKSEEIISTTKHKKRILTTSYDDLGEKSQATNSKKKLKFLSIESKEKTSMKNKHRKQSHNAAKEKLTKLQLKTVSIENVPEENKGIKKDSQENLKSSDDEDEKQSHDVAEEKTTKLQLRTTAAIQSSIEKVLKKTNNIKNASLENVKFSTVTTAKIRRYKKEKIKSKVNNQETKKKTRKDKFKTKKRSKDNVNNNNSGAFPPNTAETVDQDSTILIDTGTIKQKKKRKMKTKPTHEPRHEVAFRNFELSDQDTSDTTALRFTTETTLATEDLQESSDYDITKKSRKTFTTLASNEGMSIESFETHKSIVRKSNIDDSFLPKQETVKEVVPDALLNRLLQLEQELKAVKSQITAATKQQTKLVVESQKPTFELLSFWKGTSKFIANRSKDTTFITDKTTQKYKTKTSHIAKATKIKNSAEKSITTDLKVITRDRTATTNTYFEYSTKSEILPKRTTGRMPKTIIFDSPNFRANTSENNQSIQKGSSSDKKILISVENESPNATYEFRLPFNLSNTNINYEVEVVTNAESKVKLLKQTLNVTDAVKSSNKTSQPQQDERRNMPKLLHDENNDINDEFDAEDLLTN